MLHVDCFYNFFRYRSALVDAPDYRPRIVDFYIWWTQPMPSYYHFVVPMLEVIIPSKSYSPPVDDTMSSTKSDSSSKDTDATSSALMSPQSVLLETWVPPEVNLMDLVSKDEGKVAEEDTSRPMSTRSVLPKSWVPPGVDLIDLVFEDEGEDVEKDTSIKEDTLMDEEKPIMEL